MPRSVNTDSMFKIDAMIKDYKVVGYCVHDCRVPMLMLEYCILLTLNLSIDKAPLKSHESMYWAVRSIRSHMSPLQNKSTSDLAAK